MNLSNVQRVLGLLLVLFSISMLPPAGVALYYGELEWVAFFDAFVATLAFGVLFWFPVRSNKADLKLREGFLIVALFWTVLGLFGAIPFVLSSDPHMSVTDAAFESLSGLTTTGATVLVGLDELPRSILYYRQQIQWLGGMGIIVLAVAILPMLGVGGMQLYRAETPGPMKDNKLTPRIAETAKALWYIYFGLTVACFLAYWVAGMSLFDAIGHSFSTVAIGGFSTHDASTGFFEDPIIELVCILFMVLAGANFSLHFLAWRKRTLHHYWKDPEFRAYIWLLLGSAAFVTTLLFLSETYTELGGSMMKGLFMVVSIATTTGFATDDFTSWPTVIPVFLILLSFIGACAASTGGGMKVLRWLLLYRQGVREVQQLIHPQATILVKLQGRALPARVLTSVWAFFSAYIVVFVVIMLLVMGTGIDHLTAFSATAACLNNLGPGLGEVAANYQGINDSAKWFLVAAMVFGRLEIFTLLVLFSRTFWRR